MLVVLIGGTLKVAKDSRKYFQDNGFQVIQKYNYWPKDTITEHYDKFETCTEEEINLCEFQYPVHNGITGFRKEQIIDAARGRSNALMTGSPDNLDFFRQLKAAFNKNIRLIYLYIDKTSLENMTRKFIESEEDIQRRLKKGGELRKMYISEKALFDRIVVYEEDGELGMEALHVQYDSIIEEARRNNDIVELPYTGSDGYIFVSYSHADEGVVISILSELQKEGYRIWYDEGIYGGANWRVMLGERLEGCTDFLLFSSKNSTQSKNVRAEVGMALDLPESHPIVIRLDDATFPSGYEMYLKEYQNVFADKDNVMDKLKKALSSETKQ